MRWALPLCLIFAVAGSARGDTSASPPAERARAMAGPFPTLEAFCGAAHRCVAPAVHLDVAPLAAPFLEARLIAIADRPLVLYQLALRTRGGWFVDALDDLLYADPPRDHAFAGPARLEVRDGIARLRFGRALWARDRDADGIAFYSCEEHLVACAVGASGRASCAPPVWVADELHCDSADDDGGGDPSERRFDWSLSVDFDARRAMIVRAQHGTPRPGHLGVGAHARTRRGWRRASPFTGTRPVVFP